jgi:predicted HAD superfamily Cof-like phosphohydrolase
MNVIQSIATWFFRAKPVPTAKDIQTQLGVHCEEVAEMLREFDSSDGLLATQLRVTHEHLHGLAELLKQSDPTILVLDRVNLLREICDQVVTNVGVAVFLKLDIGSALSEVDRANYSKFDAGGHPILDANRKIIKGPNYRPANLEPFA